MSVLFFLLKEIYSKEPPSHTGVSVSDAFGQSFSSNLQTPKLVNNPREEILSIAKESMKVGSIPV